MRLDAPMFYQVRPRSLSKFSCNRRLFCPSTGSVPGVFGDTNFSDVCALIWTRTLAPLETPIFPSYPSLQYDTRILFLAMAI